MSYRTISGVLGAALFVVGAAACSDDGDDDTAQIETVDSTDDNEGAAAAGDDDAEPSENEGDGEDEQGEDDPPALLLIMDASGSMNSRDDNGDKLIDGAQEALHDLVAELPDEQDVGLRVYGHRSPNDDRENGCQDTELIHPVGPLDRDALDEAIDGYDASGFTPIGLSLEEAADDLPSEGPRTIILVSDGIDTCAPPDPCEVAEDLGSEGIDVVIHTVGFALEQAAPDEAEGARDELGCIAEATDGEFVDVETADELADTLEDMSTRDPRGHEVEGSQLEGAPIPRSAETGEVDTLYSDVALGGEVNFYRFEVTPGSEIRGELVVVGNPQASDTLMCPNVYLVDEGDSAIASPADYPGGYADETFVKHSEPVTVDSDEVWLRVETDGCTGGAGPVDHEFDIELELAVLD